MVSQLSELNGLLVVDKPGRPLLFPSLADGDAAATQPAPAAAALDSAYLLTSHDVVNRVRRWSGQRRIGHTGTLDPLASGLLLLCLGPATRMAEYYQGETKQYYAEILLGAATDTYDAEGKVTDTAPIPAWTTAGLEAALAQFRGEIQQAPPAFAAIKQGGAKLYDLARQGVAVAPAARTVNFYRLELVHCEPPDRLALRVVCSAGAYIRSLAHDLGRALGTFAHLTGLRRTGIGAFRLHEAWSLAAIEEAARGGRLDELLLPPGSGLPLPRLTADDDSLRRLGFGQAVVLDDTAQPAPGLSGAAAGCDGPPAVPGGAHADLVQVCDRQARLAGIARRLGPVEQDPQRYYWRAEKWFVQG